MQSTAASASLLACEQADHGAKDVVLAVEGNGTVEQYQPERGRSRSPTGPTRRVFHSAQVDAGGE